MRKLYVVGAMAAIGAAAPMAYAVLDRSEQAEIEAIQVARLSLPDAIKAARAAVPGSPVEAGLEVDDGATFYEVSLYADGRLATVRLDPNDGRIVSTPDESSDEDRNETAGDEGDDADSDDLAEGANTAAQPVDLAAAIAAAQAQVAGPALEASLEQQGQRQLRYHVGIVQDGVVRDVQVDPRTGHVVPSHHG